MDIFWNYTFTSWFEIPEIFHVKRKGFFHVGEKLAISLVDHDGTRSWCKREHIHEQQKLKIGGNGTVISAPTGWNGRSGVPLKVFRLFWKF